MHITLLKLSNCFVERRQTIPLDFWPPRRAQTSTQLIVRSTIQMRVYHKDIHSVDELKERLIQFECSLDHDIINTTTD